MNYIVLDLEFNQPFQFENGLKTQLIEECPFEIIQVGAVKLNACMEIIQTADFLIRPQLYTILHPYVEKLTDLKMDMLDNQPFFPDIYDSFLNFLNPDGCEQAEYIFCTWGGADIIALYKNVSYYKLDFAKITNKYINVQEMATKKLKSSLGKNIGLKNAVKEFNIDDGLNFHNALNDALYTAKIFTMLYDTEYTVKELCKN